MITIPLAIIHHFILIAINDNRYSSSIYKLLGDLTILNNAIISIIFVEIAANDYVWIVNHNTNKEYLFWLC